MAEPRRYRVRRVKYPKKRKSKSLISVDLKPGIGTEVETDQTMIAKETAL